VITGEFPHPKDELKQKIEENGGVVVATISKSNKITHIVLGENGTTDFGGATGTRSKKYRDAVAMHNPAIVTWNFVQEAIDRKHSIFAPKPKK